MAYYSQNEMTEHISFLVTSDCLEHSMVAVKLFQRKLCSFFLVDCKISLRFTIILIVLPCSIKSGNISINLCYDKDDFRMAAKWHFFAMSHSKDACNGTGGKIKRLGRKVSLQNPYEQTMTPK